MVWKKKKNALPGNCRYDFSHMLEFHEEESGDGRDRYFFWTKEVDQLLENINESIDFYKRIESVIEDINDSNETKFNPIEFRCCKPIGPVNDGYSGDTPEYLKMLEGHFTISVSIEISDQRSVKNSIPILSGVLSHIESMNIKNDIKVSIENTQLRGTLSFSKFERSPTYLVKHTFNLYI